VALSYLTLSDLGSLQLGENMIRLVSLFSLKKNLNRCAWSFFLVASQGNVDESIVEIRGGHMQNFYFLLVVHETLPRSCGNSRIRILLLFVGLSNLARMGIFISSQYSFYSFLP